MHKQYDSDEGWASSLLDEARPRRRREASGRHSSPRRGRTIAMAVCAFGLLFGAPIGVQAAGEGDPLLGGERNPGNNQSQELTRETEIIANTPKDTYGTRQSNKGQGGGAIYGCRSSLDRQAPGDPAKSTPCLRVNNLAGGKAFDFVFDESVIGGVIQAGNSLATPQPEKAPFITNAGAVALGLNADRVDNLHASQIIEQAVAQSVAKTGGSSGGAGENPVDAGDRPGAGVGHSGECPANTFPAGDGCLELEQRDAAPFEEAATTCLGEGRRLAPAEILLVARQAEQIDLGGGEITEEVSGPLSVDLNQILAPLLNALSALPLLPDFELDPATLAAHYTVVPESGSIGGKPIPEESPFRCFIN